VLHQQQGQQEDFAVSKSVDEEKETQGNLVCVRRHLSPQAPVSRLPEDSFSVASSPRQRHVNLLLHILCVSQIVCIGVERVVPFITPHNRP